MAVSMRKLITKFKKFEERYGDQGTSDKYEEDKNNGDCDTGSAKRSGRWLCSV